MERDGIKEANKAKGLSFWVLKKMEGGLGRGG